MRSIATTALAACLLLQPSSVLAADGTVEWNVGKRGGRPKLARRAGTTFEEVITNEKSQGGYFSTCKVGTPAQDLTLQLDTGSSDIWVPDVNARVCTQVRQSGGCTLGTFNPKASSTYKVVGPGDFNISYVDGSQAVGDYFADTFEIGGATLKNLTMGLGEATDIPYGLVGVGYAINEASVGTVQQAYPNLPVAMQQAGLVNTVAYSLWLNDLGASTGSILFGGIDTAKYEGELTRISILKDARADAFTHFIVPLTSVTASSSSGTDGLPSTEFPMPVVLDSGTTLSYVSTDLAQLIWAEVGAVYVGGSSSTAPNMAALPCSRAGARGSLTFGFAGPSGPQISVGMDELVIDLSNGAPPTFPASSRYAGQSMCFFGVQNFSGPPYLLGDSFLRSAYVVYDLVNNEIGLARTDFNATATHQVAFPSDGAVIPSSTAAPNQDQAGGLMAPAGSSAAGGFQESAAVPSSAVPWWTALGTVALSTLMVAAGGGALQSV